MANEQLNPIAAKMVQLSESGANGVRFADDGDYYYFAVPKKQAKPEYQLKAPLQGSNQYEVPKNHKLTYFRLPMNDGTTITLMRLFPASAEEMAELHKLAVDSGLKVAPLRVGRQKLTVAALKASASARLRKLGQLETPISIETEDNS